MQYPKTKLIIPIVSLVILLSLPLVDAQMTGIDYGYSTGIAVLSTEDIGLRVTAYNQVPHFQWWNMTSPRNDYHLMFLRIFETDDVNNNGIFELGVDLPVGVPYVLPSDSWEFSGFKTHEVNSIVEYVQFNFTVSTSFPLPTTPTTPITTPTTPTSPTTFPVTQIGDDELQIRIHMNASNPQQIKFDVFLSHWYWLYDDSLLVFQFTVTESIHGQDTDHRAPSNFSKDGTRFNFDAAYMEYAEQASAGNKSISVFASSGEGLEGEGGTSIYLSFQNFGNESLVYDPTLGINGSTPVSSTTSTTGTLPGTDIEYDEVFILFGGVSIITLVAILSKHRR